MKEAKRTAAGTAPRESNPGPCVIARKLPRLLCGLVFLALSAWRSWRTDRMARHKQECIRLPYTAALASQRAFFVKVRNTPCGKGNARRSSESGQVKIQNRNNQLRFQSAAQIIVHLRMRTALRIIACPCGKRRYVAGVVADHTVYRVRVALDSGGNDRIRKKIIPGSCGVTHPYHLPSALSAADRISACGC